MVNWDRAHVALPLAAVCSGLGVDGHEAAHRNAVAHAGVGVSARFATQQIGGRGDVRLACDAALLNEPGIRSLVEDGIGPGATTAQCLAALYERFGVDFVNRLEGDFSIVLWDDRQQQLFAAIDGFGAKRLVYYEDHSRIVIASRIDAVLAAGGIDASLDPRTIPNILNFSTNLAPATAYRHIHRLAPGTLLLARQGRSRTQCYWSMSFEPSAIRGEERLCQRLESMVQESVAAHLPTPGPAIGPASLLRRR